MRLNEAIDKGLLDKIMPFDKWREIQTDPKARRRYEKEQKEKQEREEQERLKSKYASMTLQEQENVWWRNDKKQIGHMFEYAPLDEEGLERWAETLDDTMPFHVALFKAKLLIDFVGGVDMTKGDFGNRVISNMAKHKYNVAKVKQYARSVKQQRQNHRRNNLSPEELERRDREWEKQQQQRDERSAERQREQLQQDKERWCRNCNEEEMREFAKTGPIGNGETLRRFLSIPNMTDEIMAIAAARIEHPNLAEIIIDAAGGPDSIDTYGDRTIKVLTKSKHPKTRAMAQSAKQSRRKARGFYYEHRVLKETIDRSLLDKIPNFDEWRDAGGSMAGYYQRKLEKKYPGSTIYGIPNKDDAEIFKWALSQKPERTPDGAIWDEKVAEKMSRIVGRTKFMTYTMVHYHQDDSHYPDVVEHYYKDGRFHRDDPYRGRGY